MEPVIRVFLVSPSNLLTTEASALIDTGADVSLFDESLALDLGIDLSNSPSMNISGVGGLLRKARVADVTIQLLKREELSVTLNLAFAPDVQTLHGNLIGLDVLEHFDFALSHAKRTGYLSPAGQ